MRFCSLALALLAASFSLTVQAGGPVTDVGIDSPPFVPALPGNLPPLPVFAKTASGGVVAVKVEVHSTSREGADVFAGSATLSTRDGEIGFSTHRTTVPYVSECHASKDEALVCSQSSVDTDGLAVTVLPTVHKNGTMVYLTVRTSELLKMDSATWQGATVGLPTTRTTGIEVYAWLKVGESADYELSPTQKVRLTLQSVTRPK